MKQSTLRKLLEDVAAAETAITGADPAPMPDVPETDAPNKGDEVLELLREIRDLLANVYGGEEQEELVIPEETAVTEPEAEELEVPA